MCFTLNCTCAIRNSDMVVEKMKVGEYLFELLHVKE